MKWAKIHRIGHLEDAMAELAGLPFLCKLLLLRVGQIKQCAPSLNGLVEPMDGEIVEIMEGIKAAQRAHEKLWQKDFMSKE